MEKNQIILDTDPGIDDAIAMIVLLKSCGERVRLILSSYGNISINNTTTNALTMLSLLDMKIPVVRGVEKPDNDKYIEASHIHGVDGLGGLAIDLPTDLAIEGDFLQITYDAIIKAGKVDYITLGPLTNLALLIKRFPDVLTYIDNVVTMGGGIGIGNVTEFAEFNIHCDAVSANYVFDKISKLALVPLNTTNEVAFSLEQIATIESSNKKLSIAAKKILTANFHACVKYGELGSTMHDSTAVLYYLYPELFKTINVGIEVDEDEYYGKTSIKESGSNIVLIKSADSAVLIKTIMEIIAK